MKQHVKFLLLIGFAIAFSGFLHAQPIQEKPRDSAYPEDIEKERKIIPYDNIREADVFWKKRVWRVIDAKEKINLPFVNPKEPFISVLFDAIKNEQIRVYDPAVGDDFSQPMTYADIEKILVRTDTTYAISPYTYNDTVYVTSTEMDPLTITKFRIKEDWIFDEETSNLVVRILGIAPVRDVMDNLTGEKRGESTLFWLYYPDARQLLANNYAYNPYNAAVQMTWEDVFEMRMFGSYIVKEDNVYDREIQNYATGIDAVLESERIKKDIFQFEHDLWEF